jgi:hypothetical protein
VGRAIEKSSFVITKLSFDGKKKAETKIGLSQFYFTVNLVGAVDVKAAFIIVEFQCPARLGTLKISAAFSIQDEPLHTVSERVRSIPFTTRTLLNSFNYPIHCNASTVAHLYNDVGRVEICPDKPPSRDVTVTWKHLPCASTSTSLTFPSSSFRKYLPSGSYHSNSNVSLKFLFLQPRNLNAC